MVASGSPETAPGRLTPPQVLVTLCALAIAAIAIVRAGHAAGYFFLFDDFALNGQASRWPLHDIVATPLFGFYRPAWFLVMRGAHAFFGWHTPAGYAFLLLSLHVVNAILLGRLVRRVVGTASAAWLAMALFFAAPWSAEAVFWVSAGFDVLATMGVLAALMAGLAFTEADRSRSAVHDGALLVAAAGATALAFFSKESAVIVPGLFPLVLLSRAAPIPGTRAALAIGVMLVATAVGLGVRLLVTSNVTGGVYGDWFHLLATADLTGNLRGFLRAVFVWPGPHDALMRPAGLQALVGPVASVSLALLVVGSALKPRQSLALLAGVAVCLLPVLWIGLPAGSSSGGRALYLPGVPLVMCCALGLEALLAQRRAWLSWTLVAATAVLLSTGVASLQAQRAIWSQSAQLSRASIDAFRAFVNRPEPIHIDNLPFWFQEGPYVIKSYAFGYYYFPEPVPPVSATALSLVAVDGRARVTTRQPEPGVPPSPVEGRHVVLPIDVR